MERPDTRATRLLLREAKASVNTAANAQYWQLTGWFNGSVTFLKKYDLNTDGNIQYRQKDDRFPDKNDYITWNASIRRRFFKSNALEMEFKVFDILNQNRGYQRNFNSYSFTETYYQTLKRFWQLGVTWNFSKNGKPAEF